MAIQELPAEFEVVAAALVIRVGEVVTRTPHPLVLVTRIVLIRRDRKAREGDARRSDRDAVGLLPVVRPGREVLVRKAEHRLPHLDLVDGRIVQHLSKLDECLSVVLVGRPGRSGESRVPHTKRFGDRGLRELAHQARLG